MSKVIAYLRVSTDKQDMEVQRKEIRDYSSRNGTEVDQWIETEISSRKSVRDRGIDDLIVVLKRGKCGSGQRPEPTTEDLNQPEVRFSND